MHRYTVPADGLRMNWCVPAALGTLFRQPATECLRLCTHIGQAHHNPQWRDFGSPLMGVPPDEALEALQALADLTTSRLHTIRELHLHRHETVADILTECQLSAPAFCAVGFSGQGQPTHYNGHALVLLPDGTMLDNENRYPIPAQQWVLASNCYALIEVWEG